MRVCLFEDSRVADLEPLALTRTAFELVSGARSLGSKQCCYFPASEVGVLVRPELADWVALNFPTLAVNDFEWIAVGETMLVNARWLAPRGGWVPSPGPHAATCHGEPAYLFLSPDYLVQLAHESLEDCLVRWLTGLAKKEAGGSLIQHPWQLIEANSEQLCHDLRWLLSDRGPLRLPTDLNVVGPTPDLAIDPSAEIEPGVVVDTRKGPVVIERNAVLTAFTRIEGPCYVGPGSQLMSARIRGGTTVGPDCRVGGEVEASILLAHVNKYHDGFLGHSYLGEWVNIGAGTQCSDLRNDYGDVRVPIRGRLVQTGQRKAGSVIGDHAKTAIGTLLNTGSNIGAFAHLLPSETLAPKYVPPFTQWRHGRLVENWDWSGLINTASLVMSRRGRYCTPIHAALYRAAYEGTAEERRRAILASDCRCLRKTA